MGRTPTPLKFLIDLVGIDRVVLGSDLPFDMADVHFRDYFSAARLDPPTQDAITATNAVNLFGLNGPGRPAAVHGGFVRWGWTWQPPRRPPWDAPGRPTP